MSNIFIKNYTKYQIDSVEIEHIIRRFLIYMKLPANLYVEVIIVGKDRIQTLNQAHRHIDKPTDVLSFPIHSSTFDIPHSTFAALGSVVLCPIVAKARHEDILDLVIHGLIHLCGYDHESDQEAEEFDRVEDKFKNQL